MVDFGSELGTATLHLRTDSTELVSGLAKADASIKGTLVSIGKLAAGAAVIGVGIGVVAVKMAADFQKAMELIHTQAGATQGQVDSMSKSVLSMATSVGTSADQLADGLYHVVSQGVTPGAKALDVLRVAAEGAKVGNADLVDVTNALGAAISSGIPGAQNYTQAMGDMIATAGAGDMQMQDLANAMGTGIVASAKVFGLSLLDVNSALAVYGDNNIRGAAAGTKLRMAISMMAAPSQAAQKALEGIGLSSTQLGDDMRKPDGLMVALTDLKQHLADAGLGPTEQGQVLSAAFGSGKTSSAVMVLLDQLPKLQSKYDAITKGANSFGDAWTATTKNVSFQFDQLKAGLGALGIKIGEALLPAVSKIMASLTKFVGWLSSGAIASAFQSAFGEVSKILSTVANAFSDFFGSLKGVAHIADVYKALVKLGDGNMSESAAVVKGIGFAFAELLHELNLPGFDLVSGVFDGISQAVSALTPFVERAGGAIRDAFNNLKGPIEEVGASIIGAAPIWKALGAALVVVAAIDLTAFTLGIKALSLVLKPTFEGLAKIIDGVSGGFRLLEDHKGNTTAAFVAIGAAAATFGAIILIQALPALGTIVVVLAGMALGLVTTAAGWVANAAVAAVAWIAMLGPAALLIPLIALIAVGIYELASHWGQVKAAVEAAWNAVVSATTSAWRSVVNALTSAWATVSGLVKSAVDSVVGTVTGAWNSVTKATTTAWDTVKGVLSKAWDWIKTAVSDVVAFIIKHWTSLILILGPIGLIVDAIHAHWDAIVGFTKKAWDDVSTAIMTVLDPIISAVTTAMSAVSSAVTTTFGAISSAITTSLGAIESAMSAAWGAVSSAATTSWAAISSAITTAIGAVASAISSAMSAVESAVESGWNAVVSATSSAWDTIKSTVTGAFTAIVSAITSALGPIVGTITSTVAGWVTAVLNFVSPFTTAGANLIKGIISGITGAVGDVVSAIVSMATSLWNGFTSFFGIHSPSTLFATAGRDMIAGLLSGLVAAVGGVLSWFAGLPGRILGAIGNVHVAFSKLGASMIGGIKDGIDSAAGTIYSKAQSIASKIGGILNPSHWPGSPVGIQNWFPYYFNLGMDNLLNAASSTTAPQTAATTVGHSFVNAIRTTLAGSIFSTQVGTPIAQGIAQGMIAGKPAIDSAVGSIGDGIVGGFTTAAARTKGPFSLIGLFVAEASTSTDAFVRSITSAKDPTSALATNLGNLTNAYATQDPTVLSLNAKSAEYAVQIAQLTALGDSATASQKAQLTTLQGLKDQTDSAASAALSYATALTPLLANIKAMPGMTKDSSAELAGLMHQMLNMKVPASDAHGVISKINKALDSTDASTAISQLNNLKSTMDPAIWATAAAAIGPALIEKISSGISDPAERAKLLAAANALGIDTSGAVGSGLTNGPAVGDASALGVNLTNALAGGINLAKGNAVAAALGLAQSVTATLASAKGFFTHSPSKVTTAMGVNVAEGLAVGITQGTPLAVSAATDTAQSFLDSMHTTLTGAALSSQFGDTGSAIIQAVTDSLSDGTNATKIPATIQKLVSAASAAGIPNAQSLGIDLANAVATGLDTGSTAPVEAAVTMVNNMIASASSAAGQFGSAMTAALNTQSLVDQFGDAGSKIIQTFEDALTDPTQAAKLPAMILAMVAQAKADGVPNAQELGDALGAAIASGLNGQAANIGGAIAGFDTKLTTGSFGSAVTSATNASNLAAALGSQGTAIMAALTTAITTGGQASINALAGDFANMQTALNNKATPAQAAYLGTNIMTALNAAITDDTPATEAALQNAMETANIILQGGAIDIQTNTTLSSDAVSAMAKSFGVSKDFIVSNVSTIISDGLDKLAGNLNTLPKATQTAITTTLKAWSDGTISMSVAIRQLGNDLPPDIIAALKLVGDAATPVAASIGSGIGGAIANGVEAGVQRAKDAIASVADLGGSANAIGATVSPIGNGPPVNVSPGSGGLLTTAGATNAELWTSQLGFNPLDLATGYLTDANGRGLTTNDIAGLNVGGLSTITAALTSGAVVAHQGPPATIGQAMSLTAGGQGGYVNTKTGQVMSLSGVDIGAAIGFGGNAFDPIKLAKGGIVTRPTLAMVGEAGPEAVVPLDRTGAANQRPVVNMYNTFNVEGDADEAKIKRVLENFVDDQLGFQSLVAGVN